MNIFNNKNKFIIIQIFHYLIIKKIKIHFINIQSLWKKFLHNLV